LTGGICISNAVVLRSDVC